MLNLTIIMQILKDALLRIFSVCAPSPPPPPQVRYARPSYRPRAIT